MISLRRHRLKSVLRLLLLATAARAEDPAALFATHCSGCHRDGSEARAPLPDVLALMPRTQIVAALETGSMKAQGEGLSHEQRLAVAAHLSRISAVELAPGGLCAAGATPGRLEGSWNGWGVDLVNT